MTQSLYHFPGTSQGPKFSLTSSTEPNSHCSLWYLRRKQIILFVLFGVVQQHEPHKKIPHTEDQTISRRVRIVEPIPKKKYEYKTWILSPVTTHHLTPVTCHLVPDHHSMQLKLLLICIYLNHRQQPLIWTTQNNCKGRGQKDTPTYLQTHTWTLRLIEWISLGANSWKMHITNAI